MKFVAFLSSSERSRLLNAAKCLKKSAEKLGHDIKLEIQTDSEVWHTLSLGDIAEAQVVVIVADCGVSMSRFAEKRIYSSTLEEIMQDAENVLKISGSLVVAKPGGCSFSSNVSKKLIAVTSCPTGIAHTFLAAASLQKAADKLGYKIRVETQGSLGPKDCLTEQEIKDADAVVIAADTNVDTTRFFGRRIYITSTKHAIRDGSEVIVKALAQPVRFTSTESRRACASIALSGNTKQESKKEQIKQQETGNGFYKHLLTGVSYMLPILIVGSISIALAFAFGGVHAGDQRNILSGTLHLIGEGIVGQLFVTVFAGFIAFSIAGRSALASGLIGGMLAHQLGLGFLGGIVAGFFSGYFTKFLIDYIRLPITLDGLKTILLVPCISSIVVGFTMIHFLAVPLDSVLKALTVWLRQIEGANAVAFGAILGGMMAFDMGGPVNKAAYTFALGLLASQMYTPMAAVVSAGMTPPLGVALAAWWFKNRFDEEERKAATSACILGMSFVTEGAILYAAKDPLRVIPSVVIGGATTGAASMFFNVNLLVPHGGLFTTLIPGAVESSGCFLTALATGTLVVAVLLFFLKKPLQAKR